MDMQVYVANLGKYNEGELVGAWFAPPLDEDEIAERIGLNEEYEEYAIHDYELPFEIDEYTSIDKVNRLCEMAGEVIERFPEKVIDEMIGYFFRDIEDMYENMDDIIDYSFCDDMTELALYLIEESGMMADIPDWLSNYIDYESYGQDLCLNGNFLETSHGIYEYVG